VITSRSVAIAVSLSVCLISGSFAAASRTLPIQLYRASSPGSGGTCFITAGNSSKNVWRGTSCSRSRLRDRGYGAKRRAGTACPVRSCGSAPHFHGGHAGGSRSHPTGTQPSQLLSALAIRRDHEGDGLEQAAAHSSTIVEWERRDPVGEPGPQATKETPNGVVLEQLLTFAESVQRRVVLPEMG
jgi:hypothetical protein